MTIDLKVGKGKIHRIIRGKEVPDTLFPTEEGAVTTDIGRAIDEKHKK